MGSRSAHSLPTIAYVELMLVTRQLRRNSPSCKVKYGLRDLIRAYALLLFHLVSLILHGTGILHRAIVLHGTVILHRTRIFHSALAFHGIALLLHHMLAFHHAFRLFFLSKRSGRQS